MPWKRNRRGGYRTKRGGNIKRPARYEALRRKGLPKTAAARIANGKARKRKR